MSTVFVNAAQARIDSRNQGTIHAEVRAIEGNILANIDNGVLYANITGNTTMTSSNVYYNVWNSITSNTTVLDQITCVRQYFLDLGYSVTVKTNTATNNTITWNIAW